MEREPTPEQADYAVSWPVIETLVNLDASEDELRDALRIATDAEAREAQRRLAEERGRQSSQRDEVQDRLDELVTRYPGLKSVGRGPDRRV
jgi:hypothetical protein